MREAIYAKFTQHNKLMKALKDTKGSLLIEYTKNDCYWGDGGDGSGQNMLGIILMEVRDFLFGDHPSYSWSNINQIDQYREGLKKYLANYEFIEDVIPGLYHGDTLCLNVRVSPETPLKEYRRFIPNIFRGFQVNIAR